MANITPQPVLPIFSTSKTFLICPVCALHLLSKVRAQNYYYIRQICIDFVLFRSKNICLNLPTITNVKFIRLFPAIHQEIKAAETLFAFILGRDTPLSIITDHFILISTICSLLRLQMPNATVVFYPTG